MSLVALAAVTGAAQFGASVLGAMAHTREAEEMARRRARAARFARDDASEDLQFQQSQLDIEDRSMRVEASVARRGMDLQETAMAEQAMEEHGMMAVSQAMRGVSGSGTGRSFGRQLNQSAHAFQSLGLERTAAFGRERRASEMMNMNRNQMHAGFARQVRDIQAFEQDTTSDLNRAKAEARDMMIGGAIEGATTAGLMMYQAGAFGGGGAGGVQGAGAGATTASNFTTDTNFFNSMGTRGLTMDPLGSITGKNASMLLQPRAQLTINPNLNLTGNQRHFIFQ